MKILQTIVCLRKRHAIFGFPKRVKVLAIFYIALVIEETANINILSISDYQV